MSRKNTQSQWTAQFAVASELCRRGYTVSFTMGHNTPVADLLCATAVGEQFMVDVKGTLNAKDRQDWLMKPANPHLAEEADRAIVAMERRSRVVLPFRG